MVSPAPAGRRAGADLRQCHDRGRGERHIGRRHARRDRGSRQPSPDRESPQRRHRRPGPLPDRGSAARPLHGHVQPPRLQHVQAGGHGLDVGVHRHDQCRDESGLARRDGHGFWRSSGGGRSEHQTDHHRPARHTRCAADLRAYRRPGRHHPGCHVSQRRHAECWKSQRASSVRNPRRPPGGQRPQPGRHQSASARWSDLRLQQSLVSGGGRRDERHVRRTKHGRCPDQHGAQGRRQHVLGDIQDFPHRPESSGQQSHRRPACAWPASTARRGQEALRHRRDLRRPDQARQSLVLLWQSPGREPGVSAGELFQQARGHQGRHRSGLACHVLRARSEPAGLRQRQLQGLQSSPDVAGDDKEQDSGLLRKSKQLQLFLSLAGVGRRYSAIAGSHRTAHVQRQLFASRHLDVPGDQPAPVRGGRVGERVQQSHQTARRRGHGHHRDHGPRDELPLRVPRDRFDPRRRLPRPA